MDLGIFSGCCTQNDVENAGGDDLVEVNGSRNNNDPRTYANSEQAGMLFNTNMTNGVGVAPSSALDALDAPGPEKQWTVVLKKMVKGDKFGFVVGVAPDLVGIIQIDGGGLLEKWNAQQTDPDLRVQVDDLIRSVNGVSEPCSAMKDELVKSSAVTIVIVRKTHETLLR